MSNREAGHIILEEADFSQLANLPNEVGFRVYSRSFQSQTVWLVGTGKRLSNKKWDPGDHPFCEAAPNGSKTFVTRVQELAKPFCEAIDAITENNRLLGETIGTKSWQIGELSLGQQIATILDIPVLSFISDEDNDDVLACIHEPGTVRRILCRRTELILEFADGIVSVSPECPEHLSGITGVQSAVTPRQYENVMHEIAIDEIDAFVGEGFADPDQVLPGIDELTLIGERNRNGDYRPIST